MNNFLLKAAENHLDTLTVDKIYLAAALVSSAHKKNLRLWSPSVPPKLISLRWQKITAQPERRQGSRADKVFRPCFRYGGGKYSLGKSSGRERESWTYP